MGNKTNTNNYKDIFENVKKEILKSQYKAMQTVNKELFTFTGILVELL